MTLSHRPMRPVARVHCLATALLVMGLGACATPVDQHKRVEAYGRANPATLPNRPDDSLLLSLPAHREAFTHYVEFRARYALSYGHTFLVHGRWPDGRIATREVAGLHPRRRRSGPLDARARHAGAVGNRGKRRRHRGCSTFPPATGST
jgi:hypothetical protein